jgi:predicted acyltransferase
VEAKRLRSLDVFRGLTIAAMIVVNSPGNSTSYAQLDHSAWNGLTFTDLVFPFFIFIVGVSLVFSISRRRDEGQSDSYLIKQISHRTLIIFSLGLLLNGFPYYYFSIIRVPGVLQRIALTYFIAALLFLKTRIRTQALLVPAILIAYWVAMTRVPVPGFGAGDLSREGNLAAYIDRLILHGHMYRTVYDPEGLLSTLPAVATAIFGVLAGVWLRQPRADKEKLLGMTGAGTAFIAAGWIWNCWFPVNKALWTSSYVLVTGGLALYLLALCYRLIDVKGIQRWGKPFEVFGLNAIAVYLLHILFLKLQNLWHITLADGSTGNIRFWITEHLFGRLSPMNASLCYALAYTLFWYLIFQALYRKKIFIKI